MAKINLRFCSEVDQNSFFSIFNFIVKMISLDNSVHRSLNQNN